MPIIFKEWNQGPEEELDIEEVIYRYKNGFSGAKFSQEAYEQLRDEIISSGGYTNASDAAYKFGWVESGQGKLTVLFPYVEKYYPGSIPGPAQARGDCVSHSGKNARLFSLCVEVAFGKPDEASGKVEKAPIVPPDGIRNGVLSTEASYWFRGHGGDGWSCAEDARVAIKYAGCVVRQNYQDIGIDLTRYSGSTAGKWGRSAPPKEVQDAIDNNLIRTITEADSYEEVRDLISNGYALSTCGSEGFSDTRDDNGVSKRSGSWSHAMALIGVDDRAEVIKLYGEPLTLILNSWGRWNGGPKRIYGTQIDIPDGAFWARWSDIKRRSFFAFSAVNGWPQKTIPPFITGVL